MSLHTLSSLTQIWGCRCKSLMCYWQIEHPACVWGKSACLDRDWWRVNIEPQRNPLGNAQFLPWQWAARGFLCACLTFGLSLTVRRCCRPEESSAFSCNVWNAVSIKSSLKMEVAHMHPHTHTHRAVNQHPFREKGKHNSVKWQQPSVVVNHACTQQYWDIGSAFRFIAAGTSVVTLHQAAASQLCPKTYNT